MYMNTETQQADLPTFDVAVDAIKSRGQGDLLRGMEEMAQVITDYCEGKTHYDFDDDFIHEWCWELDCFKVVYTNMQPLFV